MQTLKWQHILEIKCMNKASHTAINGRMEDDLHAAHQSMSEA